MALTKKQDAFCLEFLKDLNATQAALRAGYSQKTAAAIGWENLRKPEIQKKIEELATERRGRTEVEVDEVVKKLAIVLRGSLKKVATWTETTLTPIPSDELSDDEAALIHSLKIDEKGSCTVRIHDRMSAASLLLRHLEPIPADVDNLRLENARLRALVEQYEIDHER